MIYSASPLSLTSLNLLSLFPPLLNTHIHHTGALHRTHPLSLFFSSFFVCFFALYSSPPSRCPAHGGRDGCVEPGQRRAGGGSRHPGGAAVVQRRGPGDTRSERPSGSPSGLNGKHAGHAGSGGGVGSGSLESPACHSDGMSG